MQLNPHLNFNGQCEEAFRFYEECFGAKISFMMTYGESPMADKSPAEWRGKILHATLTVGNTRLMGADAPPDRYEKPRGFSVALAVPDPADADRVFEALTERGQICMPIQKTFWTERFGMLVDRFGIPWMINCEPPA